MIPLNFKWFDDSTRIHLPSSLTCHHRCHQSSSTSAKQMLPQIAFTVDTAAVHVYLKVRKWSCCKPLLQFFDGWVWLLWRPSKVYSERLWTSRAGNKHIVYVGQSALHRKFSKALQFAQQVTIRCNSQRLTNGSDCSLIWAFICAARVALISYLSPQDLPVLRKITSSSKPHCNQSLATTLSSG